MKIALTGGAAYIDSQICSVLFQEKEYDLCVIDNLSNTTLDSC